MSILIKGMEMPKNCHECAFGKYEVCGINAAIEGDNTVTNSCPLIELPPHGRLIDADALEEVFDSSWSDSTWWFTNKVDEAPTVIPPDKDGEA